MISSFSTIVRTICVAAALVVFSAAGTAQAGLVSLFATQNQDLESSFTLDFGEFGGPRSALISQTEFQLDLNPDAAPGLSAAFASYSQSADPLALPNPFGGDDLSTGPLTISIEESYGGTYNSLTGQVTTSDLYRIEFTGDLSSLGIFSPVLLPGTSTGLVTFNGPNSGDIALNWSGTHTIGGLSFNYVCATNTTFTPEPASLALLGLGAMMLRRRR
ncbi:MAG: hypothetical protein DCC65_12065 [Planctomycetota bacterium]|nr:MAG: hypothetical protein DCC65_12065 [Planctomycetota bacterium]